MFVGQEEMNVVGGSSVGRGGGLVHSGRVSRLCSGESFGHEGLRQETSPWRTGWIPQVTWLGIPRLVKLDSVPRA